MVPRRKSPKSEKCGSIVIKGRKRNIYKGDQGGVYIKDRSGNKTYIYKTVPRAKKCGSGVKRAQSARRKSPKTHRGHLHVTKTSLAKKGNPVLHKHAQCKSPKRKSPKRKSPKRKSPKRKCSPRTRPSAYKCKTQGKLKEPYRDSSTGRCHYCYALKK